MKNSNASVWKISGFGWHTYFYSLQLLHGNSVSGTLYRDQHDERQLVFLSCHAYKELQGPRFWPIHQNGLSSLVLIIYPLLPPSAAEECACQKQKTINIEVTSEEEG